MENEFPLWLGASLGKPVVLEKDFDDGVRVYPAGSQGVLMAIRGSEMPVISVDVSLNPDDPSDWERVPFADIRPLSGEMSYGVDMNRGLLIF